jgi:hypothetical protein
MNFAARFTLHAGCVRILGQVLKHEKHESSKVTKLASGQR